MERNQVPRTAFGLLDPAVPEASPDRFSYIKIIFLKSVEAGFVSLVTERALSSIPSLSREGYSHTGADSTLGSQTQCPGLGETPKAVQRNALEWSLCLSLTFLSKAVWPGVLPDSALVSPGNTAEPASLAGGGALSPWCRHPA